MDGRGQAWPRLLHTANTSQLEVRLDGVSPRSNHSRFVLELLAVGGAYTPSQVEIHRSIDDEFTPSMFSVRQPGCVFDSSQLEEDEEPQPSLFNLLNLCGPLRWPGGFQSSTAAPMFQDSSSGSQWLTGSLTRS